MKFEFRIVASVPRGSKREIAGWIANFTRLERPIGCFARRLDIPCCGPPELPSSSDWSWASKGARLLSKKSKGRELHCNAHISITVHEQQRTASCSSSCRLAAPAIRVGEISPHTLLLPAQAEGIDFAHVFALTIGSAARRNMAERNNRDCSRSVASVPP